MVDRDDVILSDVSRETLDRLAILAAMIRKWSPKINLVSRTTLDTLETRHIADSAQLLTLAPDGIRHWADLGSGGGFPGLVIALIGHETRPDMRVSLIESDKRKCVFLRSVLRETGVTADVIESRIETAPACQADLVSARALAPLPKLLAYMHRHCAPQGMGLLAKGANWQDEVALARASWQFDLQTHSSRTESSGAILEIRSLTHA